MMGMAWMRPVHLGINDHVLSKKASRYDLRPFFRGGDQGPSVCYAAYWEVQRC